MNGDGTTNSFEAQCEHWDGLIKAGKINEVIHHISRLNLVQVPRSARQSLAKICRRIGLFSHGLRLLQPVIRQEKVVIEPPTPAEICEYAVLLSRNGSTQEALQLLQTVNAHEVPEASLYLAYCHITNWDYELAVPLLQDFIATSADSYTKLVARVNLVSALLAGDHLKESSELLEQTLHLAQQVGASRLIANCQELKGQVFFQQNKFSEARQELQQASVLMQGSRAQDSLFIQKWFSLMEALEHHSVAPIQKFREAALAGQQWQNVRECDLYQMKLEPDQKRLHHLTFGTPMPAYRRRIEKELGRCTLDHYILGSEKDRCLDLESGWMEAATDLNTRLNPGKKVHQVIGVLVKDFYAPQNMGTLFAALYPDEYFDINSSAAKVRQMLKWTRQWLKLNDIPANIEHSAGAYRFVIHGAFSIRVPLQTKPIDAQSALLHQLKTVFRPGVSFTAREACESLQWPRSSFLLFAESALKSGSLARVGNGKGTKYLLKIAA